VLYPDAQTRRRVGDRDDSAASHREPARGPELVDPPGGRGRHTVAVHFPVAGNMAQEQPLIRQRKPLPQPGNVRPQRVDEGLPAVRGLGRRRPDVPDQAAKVDRAKVRHREDGRLDGTVGRTSILARNQRMPGYRVHDRLRMRAGQGDRHVQHGEARAEDDHRTAVGNAAECPGYPGVGNVARRSWHRERRTGRLVAGGQYRRVRVDAAVGRQVQTQRPSQSARGQSHDVRGNPGDGGGWACHPLGVGEQLAQVPAVGRPGQESVMPDPVRRGPARQVARVSCDRAHPVGGRIQQVGGVCGGVRAAQPVLSPPVNQGDPQRHALRGGRPE
jgi:hypothetical protein